MFVPVLDFVLKLLFIFVGGWVDEEGTYTHTPSKTEFNYDLPKVYKIQTKYICR